MEFNERLNKAYDYDTFIEICKDIKEFRKVNKYIIKGYKK